MLCCKPSLVTTGQGWGRRKRKREEEKLQDSKEMRLSLHQRKVHVSEPVCEVFRYSDLARILQPAFSASIPKGLLPFCSPLQTHSTHSNIHFYIHMSNRLPPQVPYNHSSTKTVDLKLPYRTSQREGNLTIVSQG